MAAIFYLHIYWRLLVVLPVDRITHLYDNEHRERHSHWFGMIGEFTVYAREHPGLGGTLQHVRLHRTNVTSSVSVKRSHNIESKKTGVSNSTTRHEAER